MLLNCFFPVEEFVVIPQGTLVMGHVHGTRPIIVIHMSIDIVPRPKILFTFLISLSPK